MSEPNDPIEPNDPPKTNPAGRLLGSTPERRFVAVLVGIAAVLSLGVGAGLIAARRAGDIVVEVKERHGDDVRVRVPAAIGHVALALLPERAFACSNHGDCLHHGCLESVLKAIESIPDGTVLVQVDSPDEHVVMSRERGRFLIRVSSEDEQVRVEVPVRLAGAFLRKAERMTRDS